MAKFSAQAIVRLLKHPSTILCDQENGLEQLTNLYLIPCLVHELNGTVTFPNTLVQNYLFTFMLSQS